MVKGIRTGTSMSIAMLLAFSTIGCGKIMGWEDKTILPQTDADAEVDAEQDGDLEPGEGSGGGTGVDRDPPMSGDGDGEPVVGVGGSGFGEGDSRFPEQIPGEVDFEEYGTFNVDGDWIETETFTAPVVVGATAGTVDEVRAGQPPFCIAGTLTGLNNGGPGFATIALDFEAGSGALTLSQEGFVLDVSNFGNSELSLAVTDEFGDDYCALINEETHFVDWRDLVGDCFFLTDQEGAYSPDNAITGVGLVARGAIEDVDYAMCLHGIIEGDGYPF